MRMNTIIGKISGDSKIDEQVIARAGEILGKGGLVAFPTETVYGLGGDAMDYQAAGKIYAAKGRPSDNPLIVHISKIKDIENLAIDIPEDAYRLAERFWPGPLTMILKKSEAVPETVTGGLQTVAIRLPAHPIARDIIAASGTYIAAPSANISGRPSPTDAKHVIEDLSGRIDMIVDGGSIEIGLESTIVDLTEDIPTILRPGYITFEMLQQVLRNVEMDKGLTADIKADVRPKAPGMKYRHYAPKADMVILEGSTENVLKEMKKLVNEQQQKGHKVGVMLIDEHAKEINADCIISIGSNNNDVARHLFAALRKFDNEEVDIIYSEAFSSEGIGQAVMNRLLKAAGHKIRKV